MRAHFRPLMVALLLTALIDNACDLGPFAPPSRAPRATCSPLALPSLSAAPSLAAGTLRFSGIVRNAETCAAVGGVRVAAYEAHSTALTISSREFARTDASGLFVLSVPAGLYRLLFVPPSSTGLASRWWVHELSYLRATALAQERTGLDMLLPRGHAISGTVTTDTGAPAPGMWILVSPATDYYDWVTGTTTDQDGHYTVVVPAGDYRVQFVTGSPMASQWWNTRSSNADADDVIVAKDIAGINATLRRGRAVTGRVTNADSTPVEGALVFAMVPSTTEWCCEFVTNVYTRADGTYKLSVPEGTYRIGFAFTSANDGHHFAYWWPGGELAMERAGPVVVDRDRDGFDLTLP